MNEYKITDEMRKMLTEFLGECWRTRETWYDCDKAMHCHRRTFTSDSDMLAVFRKIRDDGKWGRFWDWAYIRFVFNDDMGDNASWLFLDNPERACVLAAMFLEERE